jgi:hypothetical protein
MLNFDQAKRVNLETEIITTYWPTDDAVDLELANLKLWCDSPSECALPVRPGMCASRIEFRVLNLSEFRYVVSLIGAKDRITGDYLTMAGRIAIRKIQGIKLGRERRGDFWTLDSATTDILMMMRAKIPVNSLLRKAIDPTDSMGLDEWSDDVKDDDATTDVDLITWVGMHAYVMSFFRYRPSTV